jgi:pimeloyl-ACP methyl ester carboxylesterase
MTSVTRRPKPASSPWKAEAGRRHDVRDRLAQLQIPVLVTVGEHDTTIPPEASKEARQTRPRSGVRHVLRARAWHAIPLEMPDAFNALVGDFQMRGARDSREVRACPHPLRT